MKQETGQKYKHEEKDKHNIEGRKDENELTRKEAQK